MMTRRICKSRKSTYSIMCRGGEIQPLIITKKGYSIKVNPSGMDKHGGLKKSEIVRINKLFERYEKEHQQVEHAEVC